MTEERSKRREFLPLVFIVNCFKKPLLISYLLQTENMSCLAIYSKTVLLRQRFLLV